MFAFLAPFSDAMIQNAPLALRLAAVATLQSFTDEKFLDVNTEYYE